MQFKDYYEVLGVPAGADADVIKSAYRRLARKYHPDVSKEKDAENRFKAVNEAYEVLRDAKKRAAYDQLRANGYRTGEEFRPPPDWGHDFDFDGGGDASGFSDFFESLFGRVRGGAGPGPRRPRAMQARIEVDLETAHAGGSTRIQAGGRTLDVKIPAGVQAGQQIRLAGQAPGGGDLMLEVQLRAHPQFAVEGRDVTVRVPLMPWQAALGCAITVPTLGGPVELKVPAGTSSGRKLRLKGRGLGGGAKAGDQFVLLEVQAPAPAAPEQREAYKALARAFGAPIPED